MDKYRCPACGARGYRGRRCSECLYAPFTEEVAHGSHYHAGEPLTLGTRPRATRPGQGCGSYSGQRTSSALLPKLALVCVAIVLLIFVPGGIIPAAVVLWAAFGKKKR